MAINNMKNLRVNEVFDRVAEAPNKKAKIEVLHNHNHRGIRDVLKGAFDDSIQFNLPTGAPPYTPASESAPGSSLLKQSKKFQYFVQTRDRPKANAKIETLFIRMLESVHPKEAEILVLMKDKNLDGKYKGLTKKLVSEAFPGLIEK